MIWFWFIQINAMFQIIPSPATEVVTLWLVIGHLFNKTSPLWRRAMPPLHRSSLPAASRARHNQKQKTWQGGQSTAGIWGSSFRLSSQQSSWRGGRDTESRGSSSWNPTSAREFKRGLADRSEAGPCRASRGVWLRSGVWTRCSCAVGHISHLRNFLPVHSSHMLCSH